MPPDTIELTGVNSPIEVIAGKPEFHEIKLNGGRPAFSNFNLEQGYDISSVYSLYSDDEGFLWFGTDNALVKFDGHTFNKFDESNGLVSTLAVNDIMQDNAGNFWISAWEDGVYRFDGKSFQSFFSPELIADSTIICIEQDKEKNIWFGTWNNGLIKYDGNTFETFKTTDNIDGNYIYHLFTDSQGRLWISSLGGVRMYDGEQFIDYNTEDGLKDKSVIHIYEDKSGNLWFCLGKDGISKFDGESFTYYSEENGLGAELVRSIIQDNSGQYWIVSTDGLYRFDGNSFTVYKEEHGLSGSRFNAITIDKEGKIWIGSDKGLGRYDGDILNLFTEAEGFPSAQISAIIADRNNTIWIATANGLIKYPSIRESDSSIGFERYTNKHGLKGKHISSVFSDPSGNIWIGTEKGLSKFNGETFVNFPGSTGEKDLIIASISMDLKGRTWYTNNNNGVSCLDGDRILLYNTGQGFTTNLITGITTDRKGNIWFGSWPGVISKYDGIRIKNYTLPKKLDVLSIYYLHEVQNGDLWISSMGRVTRFDGTTFTNASDIEGLNGGNFGQILEDTLNDIIWFGSWNGITALQSDFDSEPTKEAFTAYNYRNGYQILTANIFCVSDNGELWYAAGDKLGHFNPQQLIKKSPPPLRITSFGINNEQICWDALSEIKTDGASGHKKVGSFAFCPKLSSEDIEKLQSHYSNIRFDSVTVSSPIPVNPVLAYDQNNLSFEFSTISLTSGKSIRYKYMLEGYDQDWSPLSKNNSARYAKVNAGNYIFKVKALSPSGLWSETSFTFSILPPWWKTWWAYSFYILIFISAIVAVDRIQRRRIKERTLFSAREKEVAQAREIKKAYHQLKTTQSQLIHAEKMASLGELTAGIAHEIQNPLNFVKNFSEVNLDLTYELLEELDNGKTEELKSLAKDIIENERKIVQHGLRADAIVKSMLQHSRISKDEKELTDINALADESLRLTFHGLRAKDKSFNADFKLEADETLPTIKVTPQEIGRVLLNLVGNAFHAVSEKNKKLDSGYKPLVIVRTKHKRDAVEIRVVDNGGGISPEIMDKIFQPFFTTKPTGEGTGLGLSMSYDIITKGHGGELRVESREGEGCEFIIILPLN